MNIAIIMHQNKKELVAQFCTAYKKILLHHNICATRETGAYIAAETGLPITTFLHEIDGGIEQIGVRIALDEIDLVLMFYDPNSEDYAEMTTFISKRCDRNRIPFATNSATAEAMVLALAHGDLNWREIITPKMRYAM